MTTVDANVCHDCHAYVAVSGTRCKQCRKSRLRGFLIAATVLTVVGIGTLFMSTAPTTRNVQAEDMTAEIGFRGDSIFITNKNAFDWTNVVLTINPGTFSGGYALKRERVATNTVMTIGSPEFADSEGRRFDPRTMKLLRLRICGDTPDGFACYTGKWD